MTGILFNVLLWSLIVVGLTAGGWYLILYKAWRWDRWHNPVVRDSSGWVVFLWLFYGWTALRLLTAQLYGAPPNPAPTWQRLLILLIGVGLDGAFISRLQSYRRALEEERRQPTRVCRRCGGRGVVPVGTPPDAWVIPWTDGTDDPALEQDGDYDGQQRGGAY